MPNEDSSPLTSEVQANSPVPASNAALEAEGRSLIVSAVLIGAGILVEPELLGGALLGAGVIYGLPAVGSLLGPLARTAIRLSYSAAYGLSDAVSGAGREIQRAAAEARLQHERQGNHIITPVR